MTQTKIVAVRGCKLIGRHVVEDSRTRIDRQPDIVCVSHRHRGRTDGKPGYTIQRLGSRRGISRALQFARSAAIPDPGFANPLPVGRDEALGIAANLRSG